MDLIFAVVEEIEQFEFQEGSKQVVGITMILADARQLFRTEAMDVRLRGLTVPKESQQRREGLCTANGAGEGLDFPVGEEFGLNDHAR